ncbi:MAG: hypothetical protein ACOYVK_03490 [Bacillota bacterium]
MRFLIDHKKKMIFLIACFTLLYFLRQYVYDDRGHSTQMVMGGQFYQQFEDLEINDMKTDQTDMPEYFRPSKLPILNDREFNTDFFWKYHEKEPSEINLPKSLLKTPEDTIINYFSILEHAENLTKDKMGGCGTVGNAKLPFPVAYAFLTPDYQKRVTYQDYLKSFEGIGHTSLIKLRKTPDDQSNPNNIRYFMEIETIEGSSKNVTYFAYYYGFIDIMEERNGYRIANMEFYGEDFLCAPYHGWAHNAEASVDIRYGDWCALVAKRYPTEQNGYVKNIYFKGTDGNDYLIEFYQLTNGTDIEMAQYKKDTNGSWKLVKLDPYKCLEEKKDETSL